jgi:ribosomal protein S18 acetylase RimI-like enzyme
MEYKVNTKISNLEMQKLIISSGLQRNTDLDRLSKVIQNSDLIVSAWDNNQLVGIARVLTDYIEVAYLADLAVDKNFRNLGVGRHLVENVEFYLGSNLNIVLLASEYAAEYYKKLGYTCHPRGYIKHLN